MECDHAKTLCACQIASLEQERDRYRDLLFRAGEMFKAPCFVCGYNGPGYFQPGSHPCAAKHHALQPQRYSART